MFSNKNDIKAKHDIDRQINLYSYFIYCGIKKFGTIDKEEVSALLKISKCISNNVIVLF